MNDLFLYRTLIKPISTEKSVDSIEKNRCFVFKVNLKSNKKNIKYAVEKLFKVVVTNVRTLVIKGRKTKFKQTPGKKSDWKKAFISLKKGYDIDLANLK
jgi:large subunit ribosomal protein L23